MKVTLVEKASTAEEVTIHNVTRIEVFPVMICLAIGDEDSSDFNCNSWAIKTVIPETPDDTKT